MHLEKNMRASRFCRNLVTFLTVVICISASTMAHAQVPSNVLRRVLLIQTPKSRGTGFTIDVDGRQYLVTAKHVVADLKERDTIEIRNDEGWTKAKVKVYRCANSVDIAVLIPEKQLTVNFPLDPTIEGALLGQDLSFVGFPYGEFAMKGKAANGFRPFPLVKKAALSAMGEVLILDGMGTHGFSGAPIVYRDLNKSGFEFRVAGVVFSYQPELLPVVSPRLVKPNEDLVNVESWRIFANQDGTKTILVDTKQRVASNVGILKGYNISFAVDLIKQHPEGPKTVAGEPPSQTPY
jgi:hypothetical protein